jgi:hypothetical protein
VVAKPITWSGHRNQLAGAVLKALERRGPGKLPSGINVLPILCVKHGGAEPR